MEIISIPISIFISLMALIILIIPFIYYALGNKRNDIADVMWGLSFIVIAWTNYLVHSNQTKLALTINILVTIWGLRLSYHIFKRFIRNKIEDRRYEDMRKTWKNDQNVATFTNVFLLQAFLAVLVSLPVIIVNTYHSGVNNIAYAGVLIWIFGFLFESRADMQLKKFIMNPSNKGKIMTKGLFKYTRHPNYFGEVLQWWGIAFMALYVSYGWIGILGAVSITFLITKVSGIPLAEKGTSKKPGWEEYKKKTPALLPKFW